MNPYTLNPISLNNIKHRSEINTFLLQSDLILDGDVDFAVEARMGESLIGTCSKAGRVIKCLAVSPEYRGEGLSAELVKAVIDRLFDEGYYHYFVFTKPDNTCLFKSLNFTLLHKGDRAALMEGGIFSIHQSLEKLKIQAGIGEGSDRIALVMNCNPFTLGHRHLVEEAASSGREVLLFVVEENRSVFSFSDRLEMVRQGTAHLKNVTVLPGTEYIISSATFPSYFLREADEKTTAYMEMDAGIFCTYFCKAFGITTRYVGEEPYCQVTLSYNNTLKRVLGATGIQLVEVPRLSESGMAISASRVRQLIREGQEEALKALIPETTWTYIHETPEGRAAVVRIQNSNTPH